ncbi:MAG TPA: oligopeptide/dipeptide ABC transporter ATP-binding protein [Acetobacteraceae bacterium]|nr:oligopeptide/dipeptide ABC transporter ATP-binding protein [Acetobacteraceae bacterium]
MSEPDPPIPYHTDRGGPRQPLLMVRDLRKHFPLRGHLGLVNAWVQAVDGVSFDVMKGETLGVVGESGCGKSTTARLLMHLVQPDAGSLVLDGDPVGHGGITVRELRRNVQMVFQDSYASLNPRHSAGEEIAFGLRVQGLSAAKAKAQARAALQRVGLEPAQFADRYPHEMSGGQRQRVNVARGIALNPRLLILDESVSALDKSVQAQVLNLLAELKDRLDLTYVFISHDLNVVHYIADRVLVMYLGKVVELGPVEDIYRHTAHPYTQALFASRLSMDPARRVAAAPLIGDPPNPVRPPSGCRFRTRCALAEPICAALEPRLSSIAEAHNVACHAAIPGSGHSRAQVHAHAA